MESLFTWLLTTFNVFASGIGIIVIGATALLIILWWGWRLFLLGLITIQTGIVVLVAKNYGLSAEWAMVQMLVTTLAALMLLLSAQQVKGALTAQRPGALLVRLMAVGLLLMSWQLFDLELPLPLLSPQIAQLFLWLGLCSMVLLGLSDAPFYTGIALLLWFMPVQAFIQILLPEHRLFILIGMVQILVALSCSYLTLTDRVPVIRRAVAMTDSTYPVAANAPRPLLPGPTQSLPPQDTLRPQPTQRPPRPTPDRTGEHPLLARRVP
ncbi:MAG: hypothetical protein R3C14_23805 [Caldilineaceae bacterium]